jgi:hypothetical protein
MITQELDRMICDRMIVSLMLAMLPKWRGTISRQGTVCQWLTSVL